METINKPKNENYTEFIHNIIEKSCVELNNIMDKWCNNYEENYSGGKMRGDRGKDIENFIFYVIELFRDLYNINVVAKKGTADKKSLLLNYKNQIIQKEHQVDLHIYKDDTFIAAIECKAYLDSCYYVRACDDFALFKKFGYDIKTFIFSLENSIDENTKIFTDVVNEDVCDDIFYLLDGKRSSTKPIYKRLYKKNIKKEKVEYFINSIKNLFDI